MERLTKRFENEITYNENREILCSEYCTTCSQGAGNCETVKNMINKLVEYEDLEEQGRIIKLPCAVGDTVYINRSMQGWYLRKKDRPYKGKVVFIGINGEDNILNVDFGNGRMLQISFSNIEDFVFFTREEAEQALKKSEAKNV